VTLLVDSHCHLGEIRADPAAVIADARAAGVDVVIDIGMGKTSSADAARRATVIDGVYAAVGIHPNDLADFETDPDAAMNVLDALCAEPRVVGIGETGLDFFRERSAHTLQERAFRAHIVLARDRDRTLIIHCRDAHGRVLEILDECGAPPRVVMHCFSGDVSYAQECARRGYFCSFAGNVTFPKAAGLRDAAAAVPRDLLLTETDAPFLAPQPFRGKPNSPSLLPHTVAALAVAAGVEPEELAVDLRRNSLRAFGRVAF